MPPRQTSTTFSDCLVDGSSSSAAPLHATQTATHDVLRLLGGRKLLFCSSIACHPDRLPRRSQTVWSTEAPLLQLHCRPPRQTPTMFSDCLSNECHPYSHPRRFRTAWATDAALLHLREMQPRQTSTTFSDCLVDGSSSSAAPLQATQTDTHDVLGLPEQRMPPRQTPTTFPDRLGNGCCTPPPPVNAIQTDIHDDLRLLGRRKLLFCSSIAGHPDKHPRRSRTA